MDFSGWPPSVVLVSWEEEVHIFLFFFLGGACVVLFFVVL